MSNEKDIDDLSLNDLSQLKLDIREIKVQRQGKDLYCAMLIFEDGMSLTSYGSPTPWEALIAALRRL